jgi:hypothetical protein
VEPTDIAALLEEARRAREGRDLWRRVGPILIALRAAGVPLDQIQAVTGISISTVSRLAPTGLSTRSTTE